MCACIQPVRWLGVACASYDLFRYGQDVVRKAEFMEESKRVIRHAELPNGSVMLGVYGGVEKSTETGRIHFVPMGNLEKDGSLEDVVKRSEIDKAIRIARAYGARRGQPLCGLICSQGSQPLTVSIHKAMLTSHDQLDFSDPQPEADVHRDNAYFVREGAEGFSTVELLPIPQPKSFLQRGIDLFQVLLTFA